MNSSRYNHVGKWRTDFLHAGAGTLEENRTRFWYNVISAALYELRPGGGTRQLMDTLVASKTEGAYSHQRYYQYYSPNDPPRTNGRVLQSSSYSSMSQ